VLFRCSFDAIGLENAGTVSRSASRGSATGAGETAACLLLLPSAPGRRGSFLYRSSDSDSELSPMSLSRKHSAATSDSSASVTHCLHFRVLFGSFYRSGTDLPSLLILFFLLFLFGRPLQKIQGSGVSNRIVLKFGTIFL